MLSRCSSVGQATVQMPHKDVVATLSCVGSQIGFTHVNLAPQPVNLAVSDERTASLEPTWTSPRQDYQELAHHLRTSPLVLGFAVPAKELESHVYA